ncbi:MAG: LIC12162 family transferase [bacterium]
MFLITTADERSWKKDEKILFLGEWCKLYSRKHIWSHLDFEILPYHWDNRNQYYKDSKYLSDVYEKYLRALSDILNKAHNSSYSIRYWRIVIGPWLRYFLDALYDRFSSIKTARDTNRVTSTWIMKSDRTEWIPIDFKHFYHDFTTDQWNHFIYSEIIKLRKDISYTIIGKNNSLSKFERKKNLSAINKTRRFILRLYRSLVPDILNRLVFISSYFTNIKDLIRLQLSLGQIPYPYGPFVEISNSDVEIKLRNQLEINLATNKFEEIFENLIPWQIPKVYVEGFERMHYLTQRYFPRNIKGIFTGNAYSHDEAFKVWAADLVEEGKKLLISQHGGNMGVALWNQSESHQISICDRFYSWGWASNEQAKIKPLPAVKLLSNSFINSNNSGPILLVLASFPRYFYCSYSIPVAGQILNYINETIVFLKSLSSAIVDLIQIRLDSAEFGWDIESRLKDSGMGKNIDNTNKPLMKIIKECRLCIATHNATVFLETFAANFPTLLFWNPQVNEIRIEAKSYYNELNKAGILHYTPESAAETLNEIYEYPLSWWQQKNIQDVKDTFCNQFAYTGENWLKEWQTELRGFIYTDNHP